MTAGVADSMEPIVWEEGRVSEEKEDSKESEGIVYWKWRSYSVSMFVC